MKIASTLFLVASLLAGCSIVFAQNQEDITLTTYYPAPYGEYNSLSANSFAVGSGASVPATSGVIAFESIDTSSGDLPGTIGDLYFDDGEATTRSEGLYYLGSSGWVSVGTTQQNPSFSVRNTGTQVLPRQDETQLAFNSEDYDTNTDFSSNKHTPTIAGKYVYVVSFNYVADTTLLEAFDDVQIRLKKNNTEVDKSIKRYGRRRYHGEDKIRISSHPIAMNGTGDHVKAFGNFDCVLVGEELTISNLKFSGYKVSD